jgi:death-on-curing protein
LRAAIDYLRPRDLISIAELEVGTELPADLEMLEEVALRPATSVEGLDAYPGLHLKAAVLFHDLIVRGPFERGNVRVAVLAAIVFFDLNGYEVTVEDTDLVDLAQMTAGEELSVLTIAAAFEAGTRRTRVVEDAAESVEP